MGRFFYLLLACVSNTLFRYEPFDFPFGNPMENHSSYSVGQAVSYLFLLGYVYDRVKSMAEHILFEIVFWCAVSNLLDELFFDPLHLGLNEILFAIFIIIWTIARAKKWTQKQPS